MHNTIHAVLQGTVEWKEFHKHGLWNVTILSAIGVVVTTCMEVWGLSQQALTIWKKRSGESVSVTLFNYTTWYFLFCGIYSISIHSAAATFSGFASSVVQIPILIGLWRFKAFRWWEVLLTLTFPIVPLSMLLAPPEWKGMLFMILSFGIIFAWGAQPLELLKTKKTGSVDIHLFGVYFVTTLVWLVFVCSVGNVPLIINQIIMTIMIILTIGLWCWYRAQEPNQPAILYFWSNRFRSLK